MLTLSTRVAEGFLALVFCANPYFGVALSLSRASVALENTEWTVALVPGEGTAGNDEHDGRRTQWAAYDSLAQNKVGNSNISWAKAGRGADPRCATLGRANRTELSLSFQEGFLCVRGYSIQSRDLSTVFMLQQALNLLDRPSGGLASFSYMRLNLGDMAPCDTDLAYALPQLPPTDCAARLIPDFTFKEWPEAGLLPNYTTIVKKLAGIAASPAARSRCGWAGRMTTHPQRKLFVALANKSDVVEAIAPKAKTGTGNGRISMEDQVSRWPCLIDLPGKGYSGRVPMLLHSGRPLLMVARTEAATDNVWYTSALEDKLVAWEHYIPVAYNLSDMEERARWTLDPKNAEAVQKIVENARRFASTHLTLDAAVQFLAEQLAAAATDRHRRESTPPEEAAERRVDDLSEDDMDISIDDVGPSW